MFDITKSAEAFPPGEFIKEELEARDWNQEDLADITGLASPVISNLINGKRPVSPDIAASLAAAFGTTAQFWMNLETAYQLFAETRVDESIARKARLFALAPIKEMVKRGWIEGSKDADILEKRVLAFLDMDSLDGESKLRYAAKASTVDANPSQVAWVCRAKKIAPSIKAEKFSDRSFADALVKLKELRLYAEDAQNIQGLLAAAGVRVVLIEGLSKGKIDGATFWLDEYSPVIALSMRFDRLDHFWYVLSHECGHVKNHDALNGPPILDVDLVGENATPFDEKTDIEQKADLFAEDFTVGRSELDGFIARIRPLYSKQRIKTFAARIGVRPALVLGQLQHRKEVDWSHSREMLVKVRHALMSTTLTDGWGRTIPTM